jgi:hypothetical protein
MKKKYNNKGKIILTKNQFYLLKLFRQYWTVNRNSKKLIYYLQFLNKEIDKNKID